MTELIEAINIKNCLHSNLTGMHNSFSSKTKLFAHLGKSIQSIIPHTNTSAISLALQAREKIGSTALGNGIAIPHARIDNLERSVASLLVLQKPMIYDADNHLVDIIFMICVPQKAPAEHNQLLSMAVQRLQSTAMLDKLRKAVSDYEIYHDFIRE